MSLFILFIIFSFSIIIKLGIISVFIFGFWKSYICTCQTQKQRCGSQRSRFVQMIGLYLPSNAVRLHKWNTWSNPPSHIPYMYFRAYFLFLHTWYVCLAMRDSHTDMNCHLSDTWLLWFFFQFEQWNLLCWRPPSFFPCGILSIICYLLVLLCSRSHVGITCIFEIGWVVLDHLIGK